MAAFSKVGIKQDITKLFTAAFNAGSAAVNKQDEQHRDTKMFHASSIGYCLRNTFLTAKHGKEQELGFLRKVNFGTAIHELYQKYLAYSGKLFGAYYCKKCGKTFGPQYATPCEDCGGKKLMAYSELHLHNQALRISGHPDGFVNLGKVHLTEIKTISTFYKIGSGPDAVDKYVPEHKRQCNLYLGLLHHKDTKFREMDKEVFMSKIDPNEYVLAYHDKGTDEMIPYKFAFSAAQFKTDLARVKYYHECVAADKMPEPEASKSACKWCSFINQCAGLTV